MTKALTFSAMAGAAVVLTAALLSSGVTLASAPQPSPTNQVQPRTSQVQQGEALYRNYCAACHGPQGEGLGENWKQRNTQGELPPPPHDETGHTWRHSDEMLYRMIREGWRDPFNKTERLTMPAFGQVLKAEEIEAVVDYLKTLWTEEQRTYQRKQTKKE